MSAYDYDCEKGQERLDAFMEEFRRQDEARKAKSDLSLRIIRRLLKNLTGKARLSLAIQLGLSDLDLLDGDRQ